MEVGRQRGKRRQVKRRKKRRLEKKTRMAIIMAISTRNIQFFLAFLILETLLGLGYVVDGRFRGSVESDNDKNVPSPQNFPDPSKGTIPDEPIDTPSGKWDKDDPDYSVQLFDELREQGAHIPGTQIFHLSHMRQLEKKVTNS